jgi:LacI family transcriptional regulator, gluconate utilization system Gnt-I transcriptional repressor
MAQGKASAIKKLPVIPGNRARRPPHSGRAATVVDVAKIAGVAANTVSRVLNNPAQVSQETRRRVEEAIRVTGYVPNLMAGGLRSARSRLVAAVVPTITGPMFLETIQALTDALDEHGYQLLLGQSGYKTSREDALLNAIIGRRPVGIVLTGVVHSAEARKRLLASGIPIVETWDLTPTPIDMAVGFSHAGIGEAVCEYLHRKGRRHPVLISGEDERAARRSTGFQRAAAKMGMRQSKGAEIPVHWVPAPATLASGRSGLAELLQRHPDTDAVICSSDLLALGVLTEAHARGIAVPKRLAVVGFGNLPFSAGVIPSLTTVHVDGPRIGRIAASFLVERAEGRKVGQPVVDVGFSIVERDSA